jgi:hypothetical protein
MDFVAQKKQAFVACDALPDNRQLSRRIDSFFATTCR